MGRLVDRTGERWGALVAVEPTHRRLTTGRAMPAWRMRCDCGAEVVAMTVNLTKGKHLSCGCQRGANMRATTGQIGYTRHPVYRVYRQMLDRCYLDTACNYRWYGAKGVIVCDRWRFGESGSAGFLCFLADMGERPEGLTLERTDPFGNYEPGNCCWATWAEQGRNRRNSK